MKNFLSLLMICLASLSFGQSVVGEWTTIDDATKKKKSKVQLFKYEGKLYGKINYLYPREGRGDNPKCTACTGDMKDEPLVGLPIVKGLRWNGTEWEKGTIVDPENGKTYVVKMWLDPKDSNKLNVRGYIGVFYRTQTWERVTD